jgi:hypothetical protein
MLVDAALPVHSYISLHRFVCAAAPMVPYKLREVLQRLACNE